MNFLLDTNVVSEVMKADPDPSVIVWFRRNQDRSFLCSITLAEIELGIHLLPAGRRRERLTEAFRVLLLLLEDRVLAFDLEIARGWARLASELEKRGRKTPLQDSIIEATAIQWRLTVVTRNTSDFVEATTVNSWSALR